MSELIQGQKIMGWLIKFILLSLCVALLFYAKNNSDIETYFSDLMAGDYQATFPYSISDADAVCALQAYQNRLRSLPDILAVDAINSQLDKANFRGEEGFWVLLRYSKGVLALDKVNRYKYPLSSPVDSNDFDPVEWKDEIGRKSVECATGVRLKFSVFINQATGEKRVGIASSERE